MTKASDVVKGIIYPILGAVGGAVVGVASSVIYIFGRIQLHVPGSVPKIDTVLNAANFSISSFLECVEAGKQCNLPVSVNIDMTSWSSPIMYASMIGAGVGLAGGGAVVFSQCLQRRRVQPIRFDEESSEEYDTLSSNGERNKLSRYFKIPQ